MMMLSVQKVTRDEIIEHWGFGFGLPNGELYIRSDRKGNVNWDKAPVYTWEEILKEREKRRVIFTVDPKEFELP